MFGKRSRAAASLTMGLSAAAMLALTVHADPYSPYEPGAEGLTVYAPHQYVRQPTTGARVRLQTVSMTVPIDDLDLSTHVGAAIAKARIVQAAKEVCDEAQRIYPNGGEPPGGCYNIAVRDALRQAQDMAGYPIVAWGYR